MSIKYLSNLRRYETIINKPTITVRVGKPLAPFKIMYVANIPDNAPVGPIILKLLPPNMAAMIPAQIEVMIPIRGVTPEATARDIDKGIDMRETVSPDFKFFLILSESIEIKS